MTILEERYMNSMPSQLRDIANSIKTLHQQIHLPIIEYTCADGTIRIEQFVSLRYDQEIAHPFYINGIAVEEPEFKRISSLISKHPLFLS